MDTPVLLKEGIYCHAAQAKSIEAVGMPNPRDWGVQDDDWKLPANWQEIILEGLRERLGRFRSLQIFMDTCVRCGACADKCHFFIGSGDPKNMPVLRAELLRSVYRKNFTRAGKIMGKMVGARGLTEPVLKEWWYYFFQCTECRRCSLFCPYGIDTAEITIIARELLNLLGLNIDWIAAPVAKCHHVGNHIGMDRSIVSATTSRISPGYGSHQRLTARGPRSFSSPRRATIMRSPAFSPVWAI